jgi:hypothetical protein
MPSIIHKLTQTAQNPNQEQQFFAKKFKPLEAARFTKQSLR